MAGKGTPSLADFAAARPTRRSSAWADRVPDDIRDEILANPDVPLTTIVDWLVNERGIKDATESKVKRLKARHDRHAAG